MSQPFLSSVIRMDRESRQLSIPLLSSQRSSPPASEMCSAQPSPFPETEPERHESLPIRSYHCPAKPECHGFLCVTSFQPAISHRLWKSSPPHQKRYADLRHLPQAVSYRAADCRRAGLQHGRYSPTARPVSGISTAGRRAVFVPITVINMVKGMTGLYWKNLPDRNNLQSNPYKTIKKRGKKVFSFIIYIYLCTGVSDGSLFLLQASIHKKLSAIHSTREGTANKKITGSR